MHPTPDAHLQVFLSAPFTAHHLCWSTGQNRAAGADLQLQPRPQTLNSSQSSHMCTACSLPLPYSLLCAISHTRAHVHGD